MVFKILLPVSDVKQKKVSVYDLRGNVVSEIELPLIFNYPVRKDIIKRAVISALTARLQPKGRDPLAGKRRVGESWGINYGLARVPRLDNGRAVIAPMTRGGRLAHPPRVDERLYERVNKKEKIIALVSALSATSEVTFVRSRGHIVNNDTLPVVVVDDFEKVNITSEAKKVLEVLKLWDDVVRAKEGVRIRSGKGKMRGRRYKEPKSLLVIVSSKDVPAVRAFRNLPGVDVVAVDLLNVVHLAPGGVPGRLTLITTKALDMLSRRFEVITL
jgi:large subunit ribosomal protein L4e